MYAEEGSEVTITGGLIANNVATRRAGAVSNPTAFERCSVDGHYCHEATLLLDICRDVYLLRDCPSGAPLPTRFYCMNCCSPLQHTARREIPGKLSGHDAL